MDTTITLHTGQAFPRLGLGTWNAAPDQVAAAVKFAILEAGYRHLDCASIYENQTQVGQGLAATLADSSVTRADLFITSKLWNTDHDPAAVETACRRTLAELQLEYLDLYLIHWGVASPAGAATEPLDHHHRLKRSPIPLYQTWAALEKLVDAGLVKSIGVANYTVTMLIDLLSYAKIKPVVNQVELHPYLPQSELVQFCHQEQIAVTAYSPLGSPGGLRSGAPVLLEDPVVQTIARVHKTSPAQILLAWALQRQTVPIPKSVQPERLIDNIAALKLELTTAETSQLNQLDRGYRFVNPGDWWGIPYFS